jgi:hypothetical protein
MLPKSPFLQDPHGVTTQETAFFIVTAVKISNVICAYEMYTFLLLILLLHWKEQGFKVNSSENVI